MTMAADKYLGVGLYTVDEAALYARVPAKTMSRWLFGDRQGQAVLDPQLSTSERVVTFLDFIQALHIRQIRTDTSCRIPLSKIREAIETARGTYGVKYPLAMEHTTFLYGRELMIKLREDQFVQVSGAHKHHQMIHQIVRVYMKDLTFNDEGLAETFRAWAFGNLDVQMNPAIRFGEPFLPKCGYSARTLWEAATAEGSTEAAAENYGVSVDEVEVGYRYWEQLQIPKAA
jgi:uncharacterized protein (DUF433 family)